MSTKEGVSCSFCGKHQNDAKRVIAGVIANPGYICDECVFLCLEAFADQGCVNELQKLLGQVPLLLARSKSVDALRLRDTAKKCLEWTIADRDMAMVALAEAEEAIPLAKVVLDIAEKSAEAARAKLLRLEEESKLVT